MASRTPRVASGHRRFMNIASVFLLLSGLGGMVWIGVLVNRIVSGLNPSIGMSAIVVLGAWGLLSFVAAAWCRLQATSARHATVDEQVTEVDASAVLMKGIESWVSPQSSKKNSHTS